MMYLDYSSLLTDLQVIWLGLRFGSCLALFYVCQINGVKVLSIIIIVIVIGVTCCDSAVSQCDSC